MPMLGAFVVPHPPIILPEVGRGEERKIQTTVDAYREIASRIAALAPQTVVITSPHATLYADYFHISPGQGAHGDLRQFGVAGVRVDVSYDNAFVQALEERARQAGLSAGTLGERDPQLDHGTLVPLRFLQEALNGFRVVRIGLSGLSVLEHYRLGKCIAQVAEQLGRRIVFVASGDLSHKLKEDGPYGFAPEGQQFDREVTAALAEADFLRLLSFAPAFNDAAGECGLRSFQIMAGALDQKAVCPEFLSYEGPFGVGYAVCAFAITGEDPNRRFDALFSAQQHQRLALAKEQEDAYVRLARFSLESFLKTGKRVKVPSEVPEELRQVRAGVFVSLKKYGQLRGCIGTIEPTTSNVAEEIVRNAVSAGTEDPRFDPVTAEELDELAYSVDVLGSPQPAASVAELDAKRFGVIVTCGKRRGLLLPNLEGVDTPEQQVAIALRKAGILAKERYALERFEVVRHK